MTKKAQTKKTTKRGFWNKLSYSQRGGLVGAILGLILFIVLHNHYFNAISIIGSGVVISRLFPLFIIEVILPLVYGSIMGKIYSKISKTKFLVILLITGLLLIFLISILVLYVVQPY